MSDGHGGSPPEPPPGAGPLRWVRTGGAYGLFCAGRSIALVTAGFLLTISRGSALAFAAALLVATGLVPLVGRIRGGGTGGGTLVLAPGIGGALAIAACAWLDGAAYVAPAALAAALLVTTHHHERAHRSRRPRHAVGEAALGAGLVVLGAIYLVDPVVLAGYVAAALAVRHRPLLVARGAAGHAPSTAVGIGGAFLVVGLALRAALSLAPVAGVRAAPTCRATLVSGPGAANPATPGAPGAPVPFVLATLGDSSTWGWFLPDRLSYPVRVAELLAADTGAPHRVVNCARPGASSRDLAGQLEAASPWEPSLYVVYVGFTEPRQVDAAAFEDALGDLVTEARSRGREVLFVTYPRGLAQPELGARNASTRRAATARDVSYVDLEDELGRRAFPARYFMLDQLHPNEGGHALIADLLEPALLPYVEHAGR